MGRQIELLDLQEADTALDRLRKARAEIVERAEADALLHELEKVGSVVSALEKELHDSDRAQARLESEVSSLGDKIAREEKKLYGGTVTNPKELGSIQEEIRQLDKQRDELETALLEAMETVERDTANVTEAKGRQGQRQAELEAKERAYSSKAADLDRQIQQQDAARTGIAENVDPELLAVYDKIRRQKGGVAVGEFHDGICGACRVELPAEEVDRMLHTDSLWRCPQCRRILVERD